MFPIFISFIVQFTDVNERVKKEKSFVKRDPPFQPNELKKCEHALNKLTLTNIHEKITPQQSH